MKVEMMQLIPVENFRKDDCTFVVSGTGWRASLQKYCLRLARWAGADTLNPKAHYEYDRIVVDTTDIVDACLNQIYQITKVCGSRPSQIIVGKKEFYQIQVTMAANFTLHSDERIGYIENGKRRELSLNGVLITLNPWMEGVIVVP